jgi:Ni,Fe-hydrogenase I large subunit
MPKIAVDPITRIEGHLRIEAQVEGGKIVDAWSSGTMWRGIEIMLQGRDPRDAWAWVQRFCGVCTNVHALASIRSVENALGITIPDNARIIRNIIAGIQMVQDHVIHFYHLHALDWVDIVSALKADPKATADLAQKVSPTWGKNSEAYFKGVAGKLAAFVERGQLGPFANGYWGHPKYKLPPEANLMAVAHYLEALDWQRDVIKIMAMLGAKNPHPQSYAVNANTIGWMKTLALQAKDFVEKVYIPDVLAVAPFYVDWAAWGGNDNFMTCGDHPDANGKLFIPAGFIRGKNIGAVEEVDHKKIEEYISHSWYSYAGGDSKGLHPWEGETKPNYTGPKPPYEFLNTGANDKYSWVKAPRYDGLPVEVGPLARVLMWYAKGDKFVQETVNMILGKLGAPVTAVFSTLGRTAARAVETLYFAQTLPSWIDELAANMKKGDLRIADTTKWDPSTWPAECKGVGFHDAPRGMLSHFVVIKNGAIANYQAVVPSTWNASPRDPKGQRGPYENALIGTPIADVNRPIEILRTIHSFDPCLACAIHLVDKSGKPVKKVLTFF